MDRKRGGQWHPPIVRRTMATPSWSFTQGEGIDKFLSGPVSRIGTTRAGNWESMNKPTNTTFNFTLTGTIHAP